MDVAQVAADRVALPQSEIILLQRGHEACRVHGAIVGRVGLAERAADVDPFIGSCSSSSVQITFITLLDVARPQRMRRIVSSRMPEPATRLAAIAPAVERRARDYPTRNRSASRRPTGWEPQHTRGSHMDMPAQSTAIPARR